MKQFLSCLLTFLAVLAGGGAVAASHPPASNAKTQPPLKLVQTIPLKDIRAEKSDAPSAKLAQEVQTSRMVNVKEHFDHFEIDLKRQRLFVTPEDHKRLDVYDLRSGRLVHTIGGIGRAHSVLYRADIDQVFVTDGDDGYLRIYNGESYRLIKDVKLLIDADAIGYDLATHFLYIDAGGLDAKLNYCVLSIVNTDTGEHLGDIKIDSNRIEAMVLEKSGPRIFLNEEHGRSDRPGKAGRGGNVAGDRRQDQRGHRLR